MNVYEKCKFYRKEGQCLHPDGDTGDEWDGLCIGAECDSFEFVCPHCKKIIDETWGNLKCPSCGNVDGYHMTWNEGGLYCDFCNHLIGEGDI